MHPIDEIMEQKMLDSGRKMIGKYSKIIVSNTLDSVIELVDESKRKQLPFVHTYDKRHIEGWNEGLQELRIELENMKKELT